MTMPGFGPTMHDLFPCPSCTVKAVLIKQYEERIADLQRRLLARVEARARKSDPSSSKRAAQRAMPSARSQAGRILALLKDCRRGGSERAYMAESIAHGLGMEPYTVRKRLPELESLGLVEAVNRDNSEGHDLLWRAI